MGPGTATVSPNRICATLSKPTVVVNATLERSSPPAVVSVKKFCPEPLRGSKKLNEAPNWSGAVMPCTLKPSAYQPDVLRLERRLWSDYLALIPRCVSRDVRDGILIVALHGHAPRLVRMTSVPECPKTIGHARRRRTRCCIRFGRTAPSGLATATYMQPAVAGCIAAFRNDLKLLMEFK